MRRLYVLYKSGLKAIFTDALILSFMSPKEEQGFSSTHSGFISARKEMNAIREEALKIYIDLIARISATPCTDKTLRQYLQLQDCSNPWWYHKLSEKNAEGDSTFNIVLQILTILHVADRGHVDNIVIYGSPIEVAQVLSSKYKIKQIKCILSRWSYHPLKGLLSRLKYLYRILYFYNALKYNVVLPEIKPKVVFQGFWDWSVQIDEKKGPNLKDNYFKLIPKHLRDKNITYAWFLWFDPYFKADSKGKSLNEVLRHTVGYYQAIFIQKFLKLNDILSIIFDFRHLYRYIRYSRSKKFRYLFKERGLDFWELLKPRLLYGFYDVSLPHYFLMEVAYRRTFSFYRPKLSLSFLELYLSSRAFYQGASFGSPETVKCAMQHTGYNREKTILLMNADREFYGKPDNIPMPVPDYFFVMGELCKDILIENGFPKERIFRTGSARYDHVTIEEKPSKYCDSSLVRLLLVVTRRLDFEMVEAALLAAKDLDIKLYLRVHPLIRMKHLPLYRCNNKVLISNNSLLEDDLKTTDLLLFTNSTVAEEAFLKGIPVLQWQTFAFDGSVFKDLVDIPTFYSVEGLRHTLQAFLVNPISFKPNKELQELVLNRCFYKADGVASNRIANMIQQLIN